MSMRTGFLFRRQIANHSNDYTTTGISLLLLLKQQVVERVVAITDYHKLFLPLAVETDEFPASFVKSKGLTSYRRQFPAGFVSVSSRALNRQVDSTQT